MHLWLKFLFSWHRPAPGSAKPGDRPPAPTPSAANKLRNKSDANRAGAPGFRDVRSGFFAGSHGGRHPAWVRAGISAQRFAQVA